MLSWLILFGVVVILIWTLSKLQQHRRTGGIDLPGPTPLPLIGNIPLLAKKGIRNYSVEQMKLGKMSRIWFGTNPQVFVNDPELIAKVIKLVSRRDPAAIDPVEEVFKTRGLPGAPRREWNPRRRLMAPAFNPTVIRTLIPQIHYCSERIFSQWDLNIGTPLDFRKEMMKLTLDTIGVTGFGHDFCAYREKEDEFAESVQFLAELSWKRMQSLFRLYRYLPNFLQGAEEKKRVRALSILRTQAEEILERRRNNQDAGSKTCMLDLMLAARADDSEIASNERRPGELEEVTTTDDEGNKKKIWRLTREQLITEIRSFVSTGHETTSNSLSFFFKWMAEQPDIQKRVHQEVDELLPNLKKPDYEDVKKMVYLSRCLNESFRLTPVLPFTIRFNDEEDMELDGKLIKKGTLFIVPIYALHRNPEWWGPNPDQYNPDNFLDENIAARPQNTFLPFGGGPRVCIGRLLSFTEAVIFISMIFQRYEIRKAPGSLPCGIAEGLTVGPSNLIVTLHKRTQQPQTPSSPSPSTPTLSAISTN